MENEIMEIHESLVNGQRKQMVSQIDEYGGGFWSDYKDYLYNLYPRPEEQQEFMETNYDGVMYDYFSDAVISYFRIKGR